MAAAGAIVTVCGAELAGGTAKVTGLMTDASCVAPAVFAGLPTAEGGATSIAFGLCAAPLSGRKMISAAENKAWGVFDGLRRGAMS